MIVTDQDYLVGKVVEVNYFTSRVLLISDINSKIPVSLQPGDIQAIMSGKSGRSGIIQYSKNSDKLESERDIIVITSGAGGVFKSGIPVGKITKENNNIEGFKVVDYYNDFTQLKYVKVISFLKETESVDQTSKKDSNELNQEIAERNQEKETLRILLEQKKIAEEVRETIEKQNVALKNQNIKLQNELSLQIEIAEQNKIQKRELQYLELNRIYGSKCKKTIFNQLFKVGTPEYKECVLKKGKIN